MLGSTSRIGAAAAASLRRARWMSAPEAVGRPVADGIDPQHAIVPGENSHHVRLGQWVSVPVVAEAEDISTAQDVRNGSTGTGCGDHGWRLLGKNCDPASLRAGSRVGWCWRRQFSAGPSATCRAYSSQVWLRDRELSATGSGRLFRTSTIASARSGYRVRGDQSAGRVGQFRNPSDAGWRRTGGRRRALHEAHSGCPRNGWAKRPDRPPVPVGQLRRPSRSHEFNHSRQPKFPSACF